MKPRNIFTGPERDELGIRMLCAWNNIPREAAPSEWSNHANASTRDAWARVAEAAMIFRDWPLVSMKGGFIRQAETLEVVEPGPNPEWLPDRKIPQ
jgi:hypothetical protein